MTQASQQFSTTLNTDSDTGNVNNRWLTSRLRTEQLKLLHSGCLHLFIILSLCMTASYIMLRQPNALPLTLSVAGLLLCTALLHTTFVRTLAYSRLENPEPNSEIWLLVSSTCST